MGDNTRKWCNKWGNEMYEIIGWILVFVLFVVILRERSRLKKIEKRRKEKYNVRKWNELSEHEKQRIRTDLHFKTVKELSKFEWWTYDGNVLIGNYFSFFKFETTSPIRLKDTN